MYQTIVIGGGPSGAMAAVAASEKNKSVLLIEKKKGLGRKLKISGGGRCNVTNRLPYDEIIKIFRVMVNSYIALFQFLIIFLL